MEYLTGMFLKNLKGDLIKIVRGEDSIYELETSNGIALCELKDKNGNFRCFFEATKEDLEEFF